jgi:two-component system OmpR family sensor kinase
MSDTASSPADRGRWRGWATPTLLFVAWAAFSVLMAVVMWRTPGKETIPFHLIYIAFGLLYGLVVWPLRLTVVSIVVLIVLSSACLGRSVNVGAIGWSELSEVPFMATLALLLVWHIRRRQAAAHHLQAALGREVDASHKRQLLTRLVSHELRTSLTITAGYTELIASQSAGRQVAADVGVVSDELTRLNRSVERLITMIRLQDDVVTEAVDLDAVLARTARRWYAVQSRQWSVSSDVGVVLCSDERLAAALDTLVENAMRHTGPDDSIGLHARWEGADVVIEVRDSGVGLTPEQVEAVNAPPPWTHSEPGASHSGLGLQIVRQVVQARGGSVSFAPVPDGGTSVVLRIPLRRGPASHAGLLTHLHPLPVQTRSQTPTLQG